VFTFFTVSMHTGWSVSFLCDAYRVEQFAQLYAKKVGVSAAVLQQTLWGDYYLDAKTKTAKKGAQVSAVCCC